MRLNKFESTGVKPLGTGEQKKTFINPQDERKIISELKEGVEKDTPRQLKGRYYLTKIAHLLLPKNIPDIYEVGEAPDGTQIIDAERILHSSGHAHLQELRQTGGDAELARKQIEEELGTGMTEATNEIARIGLAFNIDENLGNFIRDESGNVKYLETFRPWQVDANPKEIEALFSVADLEEAIDDLADQQVKNICLRYLDRLLILLAEERREHQKKHEAKILVECDPYIEKLEALLAPFMQEEMLAILNANKTMEEALKSKEREAAKLALIDIDKELLFLDEYTNIAHAKKAELYDKFVILKRAVGLINRGVVDHSR